LAFLTFLYLFYGILTWSIVNVEPPPGVTLILVLMMIAILLPKTTIIYLYVIYPNFLGNTIDCPIHDD